MDGLLSELIRNDFSESVTVLEFIVVTCKPEDEDKFYLHCLCSDSSSRSSNE